MSEFGGHGGEHGDRFSRRRVLAATGALGGALLAGCFGDGEGQAGGDDGGTPTGESMDDAMTESAEDAMAGTGTMAETTDGGTDGAEAVWRTTELEPVRGGEPFTVESFDTPVVLETFAVWCPKCDRQQEVLAGLDESVTRVALNVDGNEDAEKVASHADKNGHGWRYAISPTEMTQSLVEEFGTTVTNPPSTPVIVACQGGGSTFMAGEIHSAEKIMSAADEC